jgi:hypothetical protein
MFNQNELQQITDLSDQLTDRQLASALNHFLVGLDMIAYQGMNPRKAERIAELEFNKISAIAKQQKKKAKAKK